MFALSCIASGYGQDGLYYKGKEYDEDPFDELTYFSSGINYLSNNVYLGRHDSAALPYISPFIGYQLHNGLYGKAIVSYAPTKKAGHFDLLTLELGYDRSFGKRILTGVSAERYFYYKNSPGVRASIKTNVSLYCTYKSEKVEPTVIFAVNRAKSNDYVMGLVLGHNFRFASSRLIAYPAVAFYAGSQHYYDDYLLAQLTKKNKAFTTREIVSNAGQNKPLVFEFSAKVTYRTESWLFTLLPTYAAPMSAATIKLPNKVVTEKLSSSFFLSLEACYRHERK